MNAIELVKKNLIVKMLSGSYAYGMNTETSDVDYRGIFSGDPINILTPFFPISEAEDNTEEDTKYYALWHFMKLCLDCNPNIIELLWSSEQDLLYSTSAYTLLRDNRDKLLSSKVAFTFSGYAVAQLQRLKGHAKWINNPQQNEPPKPYEYVKLVQSFREEKLLPRDFDLLKFNEHFRLFPYSETLFGLYYLEGSTTIRDQDGSLNTAYDTDREIFYHKHPMAIIKWNREEYKVAKEKHEQYWTWKKNRNKVRSELEEKMGYDGKHASHLVRLLRMAKEILETGQVIVKRPDAQELLAIRNGSMTYNELIKYAEDMDHEIREVWYKKTYLPKKPDIKFAAKLLMEVQDLVWNT